MDPRPLTRKEFAQFLPDQRSIRAFEELFRLIPDDLISLRVAIQDTLIEAQSALYKADVALQLTKREDVSPRIQEAINAAFTALQIAKDSSETSSDLTNIEVPPRTIEQERFASTQSSSYTTIGSEIVVCSASLTVSLNAEPGDKELVTVIIQNGDVTIDGNGKNIAGETDISVVYNNLLVDATINCLYLVDSDEWVIT